MEDKVKEAEDNSLKSMLYQGKTIAQWEKEFKGEFTARQLFQLLRSGVDLGRVKLGLVDEAEDIDDKQLFKGEEFFFNEDGNENADGEVETVADLVDALNAATSAPNSTSVVVKDLNGRPLWISNVTANRRAVVICTKDIVHENINEAARSPEDVVTVDDFISVLKRNANPNDKIAFRSYRDKNEMAVFDIHSKGGVTVVDVVAKKKVNETDGITDDQWNEAYKWFEDNGYKVHDSDEGGFTFSRPINGKNFYTAKEGWELYKKMSSLNEGHNWRNGGYGGTGKSFSSYRDGGAPRGASIGWYDVAQIDPKAKGKIYGWRCGPSNFPFVDLLYPERKYKVGTMVMRNKYVKAGSLSGEKYIAIPSYFYAIKTNDEEAINILKLLGIPLDLTFGMDPNDDYSMTFTEK